MDNRNIMLKIIICMGILTLLICQMKAGSAEFVMEVTTDQSKPENEEEPLLSVEVIPASPTISYQGKKVLIYHTHTYEAYEQDEANPYVQTEKWRTADERYNVVAVGKALTGSLEALGIEVVHDTTHFEIPTLEDAYMRSLRMLENRINHGERYDLYIDVHRDAIATSSTIKRTVEIGGESSARFMVLVGKGISGGYQEKPDWESNLLIARNITENLNAQYPNMARDVKIKTGRFNQHVDNCCILIECGMNTNTLDEVLVGIPYLAQAIADAISGSDTE